MVSSMDIVPSLLLSRLFGWNESELVPMNSPSTNDFNDVEMLFAWNKAFSLQNGKS